MAKKKKRNRAELKTLDDRYGDVLASMVDLLESARRASARAVNAVMTATYWEIGRRIVELEQGGDERAKYGDEMIKRLSSDLTIRFGRGFTWKNLYRMRRFYLAYSKVVSTLSPEFESDSERQSEKRIFATVSTKLQTPSHKHFTTLQDISVAFRLSWSHYVKLLSVDDENGRQFYEQEALRGGWSVRQLDRQIRSQFYQRTLLSKNKAAMLRKGMEPMPDDFVAPEEEIKDPLVLEFLGLSGIRQNSRGKWNSGESHYAKIKS